MRTSSARASEDLFFPPRVAGKGSWPPNYLDAIGWRERMVMRYAADKTGAEVEQAVAYYSTRPLEFITHWLDTHDTRKALKGGLQYVPFVPFEKQAEFIAFLWSCLQDEQNGLVDKSRDMGVTWLACAFSIWLWRFVPGADVGWGSRKQDLVDKLDDPKSIFAKLRLGIRRMPHAFWPEGFDPDRHMSFLRIVNPETGSTITGEGGNNIGRGGRTLIYFKDESAHYEHPESIEAALMENTNVQIDISTHNGIGTVFDNKREAGMEWRQGLPKPPDGKIRVFVMDWSDHPEKTPAWHETKEKSMRDSGLLHLFRQEVDRDPAASLQGVIIPADWVRSAVDAHIALKFGAVGGEMSGFDPADEGGDLHAFVRRKGVVLQEADDWGDGDVGEGTRQVIRRLAGHTPCSVQYDCIGIGAGVKSEANRLHTKKELPPGITFVAWDAGSDPLAPKARIIPGDNSMPTNEDFYKNLKAQGWWSLRLRFERVHRMRTESGVTFPTDQLISLDSRMPKLRNLMRELSQPVIAKSGDLKLLVDKKPEGARSPNMGDATMQCYFPARVPMFIPAGAVAASLRK